MTVIILEDKSCQAFAQELTKRWSNEVFIATEENLKQAERAVYIANLDSGGKKAQMEILRSNPQVEEWLVLSQDTKKQSLSTFCEKLSNVNVRTFSTKEDLLAVLNRPRIVKNTCLVLSSKESPDTDGLITLLKEWMPDWQFEEAVYSKDPQICFDTTCSRVIVHGRTAFDFMGISFPENAVPCMVITCLEENVYRNRQPRELMQEVFGSVEGLDWSPEMQSKNFFMVSTEYEAFRLRIEKDPSLLISLDKDPRFIMWDRYGLPEFRSAYTKERMSEFLRQFDGCERLAARLLNQTS